MIGTAQGTGREMMRFQAFESSNQKKISFLNHTDINLYDGYSGNVY
jgi:hypothetical protein